MDIKPTEQTVLQLLNGNFYRIPSFQRPYSWNISHVEDFWTDVFDSSPGDYFIGTFVVYPTAGQYDPLAVVDGQQRLTTVTLALAAMRDALLELGASDIAKGLQGRIARANMHDKIEYVLQTETSFPYLQEYIQKLEPPALKVDPGEEEEALQTAYEYLITQVKLRCGPWDIPPEGEAKKEAINQIELLRDKLLAVKLILIQLSNEEDACTIFETLNTRGKDLRVSDLIKNHLIRQMPGSKNSGVDIVKEKWALITEEVGVTNIDRFIHHSWLSQRPYVGRPQLYRAIRSALVSPEKSNTFLDQLIEEAHDYRLITLGDDAAGAALGRFRDHLDALSLFRVEQPLPFLLALLREYRNKTLTSKQIVGPLAVLENFHFQFTALTAQRTGGGTARMYVASAHDLAKAADKNAKQQVIVAFLEKLRARRPKKAAFVSAFVQLSYESRSKAILRYALVRIDKHLRKSSKTPVDYKAMTIEHIAPQKPKGGGPVKNVHHVGNLLLLSEKLNQEFANNDFAGKQKLLKKYSLPIDTDLALAQSWTAKEIDKRGRELASLCYDEIFAV